MPNFESIYTQHATSYDRLVGREDYQQQLLPALAQIRPLSGLDVVELGAGTGRLTRLLVPYARRILACDRAAAMLRVAASHLRAQRHVVLVLAENERLPAADRSADLALAGWSFGHTTAWHATDWREVIGRALAEMQRVLRPGGTAIIIETLGSGRETPAAPNAALAAYYGWLEHDLGWATSSIRTDYCFSSQAEADELTGFFFDTPLPARLDPDGQAIVPECTGLWWRVV